MASSVAQEPSADLRNWAELPWDVLSLIFEKLGSFEVLLTAQAVCRPWWRLSLEPRTWRCVDFVRGALFLYAHFDCKQMAKAVAEDRSYALLREAMYGKYDWEKMAKAAVDRSSGQMEKFLVKGIGNDELLKYISDRTTLLRSLRLISCCVSDDGLVYLAKKFPMLEELEVSYCPYLRKAYEYVGHCFPQLKSFSLNFNAYKYHRGRLKCDEQAFAIAENMPELRKLQLFGNRLTNDGLLAILDGCPNLEFLDLRQCFNVKVEGNLQERCEQIKDLRLPYDSHADNLDVAYIYDYEMDEDDNYIDFEDEDDNYIDFDDIVYDG